MSLAAAARLARRETKRTLGNHLKDFAANQGQRLAVLEQREKELGGGLTNVQAQFSSLNLRVCAAELALEDESGNQSQRTQRDLDDVERRLEDVTRRLGDFERRGFFARLRWVLRGR